MSEITALEVQTKDKTRANIYLDDKFFAGISIELCVKYHLKKGMEIDETNLREIVFEDDKGKAISKAVKYIGSSLKSCGQVRDYLNKKEYTKEVVDYAIDKLLEYKYLDDMAFAKAYIATYSNKYGKMKLISQLKAKGVKDTTIDDVFAEDVKLQDSIDKVGAKYLKNKELTRENLAKLSRFLYSRGYEFDQINSYVNILKND